MSGSEPVDLRSDTVTRPTEAMRRAIAAAPVGDDVYGEDPTVRQLEELAAGMLGHGAALFVPSGTMGNQIAIHLHSRPGTDVIVEADSHVYLYELGAMAAWSGALPRVLRGKQGRLDPGDVARQAQEGPYYLARARMLVLENTHNHAGGSVLDQQLQQELLRTAKTGGLAVHLDGARIFNAAAALGRDVADVAEGYDSVMFCLSKGLGAPVGSMLCGSRELIEEARVVRKRMGGGMRQAGILAAAGLHALQHHVERVADDHRRAGALAEALSELPLFASPLDPVETNIVIVRLHQAELQQPVLDELSSRGVLAGPMGPGRIRFVTHLDIDDLKLDHAVAVLRGLRLG
jgi:threonine aldolase